MGDSKQFTISLSPDESALLEGYAAEEGRSPEAILAESFRLYRWRKIEKSLEEARQEAGPTEYTEADVEDLVHQVRREEREKAA